MKKYLIFLIATLLVYYASLFYGFSQDDFFFLILGRANSIVDFLTFISPLNQQGFPFYRPLSTQVYFYTFTNLFPGNPALFMHVFMLLLHALNGVVVYWIARKLKFDHRKSMLAGLLYTTSALHFLSIFYIAATQQLLSAFFSLLTIYLFLSNKHALSALSLLFGLLSKETALAVFPILFVINVMIKKRSTKSTFTHVLPHLFVIVFYFLVRSLAGITVQSEYIPDISPKLISSLWWYWQFSFGLPELLLDYGIGLGLVDYAAYIRDHRVAGLLSVVPAAIVLIFTTLATVKQLRKSKNNNTLAYLLWWLFGIGLVIAFPFHRYPHYLDLSLVALLFLILSLFKYKPALLITLALIINSIFSVSLSEETHWTTNRAAIASLALESIRTTDACHYNSIYFVGESDSPRELSYALSLGNSLNHLCGRDDISVYYQGVNDEGVPPESKLLFVNNELRVYE